MLADPLEDIVYRINKLERSVSRIQAENIKYSILNLSPDTAVNSDQNSWAIGDYDVIFARPNAARTINGIANGKPGRILFVTTIGSFSMIYTYQNASASAGDRIVTPTAGSITIPFGHWAIFIYADSRQIPNYNRWFMVSPDA